MTDPPFLKVAAVNACLLLAAALAIETVYGNWWGQNPLARLNVPTDIQTEIDISDLYPYHRPKIEYRRDRYGMRGHFPDPASVRILTVGGSTTAQTYVGEGDTWQDVLQRNLEKAGKTVPIANAGIDGQTVYGSIRDFHIWFPLIPRLKPWYVLLYVGLNDPYVPRKLYAGLLTKEPASLRALIRRRSGLWLIYRKARGAYVAYAGKSAKLGRQSISDVTWLGPARVTPQEEEEIADLVLGYEERLRYLVWKVRDFGARPILVTQKNRVYRVREGEVLGYRYRDDSGQWVQNEIEEYTLRKLNLATMKVCRELGAACVDLAEELKFSPGDFYDLEHNTPSGSRKIGDYLFRKLRDVIEA